MESLPLELIDDILQFLKNSGYRDVKIYCKQITKIKQDFTEVDVCAFVFQKI